MRKTIRVELPSETTLRRSVAGIPDVTGMRVATDAARNELQAVADKLAPVLQTLRRLEDILDEIRRAATGKVGLPLSGETVDPVTWPMCNSDEIELDIVLEQRSERVAARGR